MKEHLPLVLSHVRSKLIKQTDVEEGLADKLAGAGKELYEKHPEVFKDY